MPLLWHGSSWQCLTVSLPSDLYIYAVLVCCVGILSVLLFTLTIIWQSVFSKRKSRGKRTDKVMSGMETQPNHRQAGDAGQSITLFEKCIMSQGLFPRDWWVQRVRRCVSLGLSYNQLQWHLNSFSQIPFFLGFWGGGPYLSHSPQGAMESDEPGFESGSAAEDWF